MKRVVITNNTSQYLVIFRSNLIKALKLKGYEVVAVSPLDDYSSKFQEMGVSHYPVRMNNSGLNPFEDYAYFRELLELYRKLMPDVILHFTIKPNIYGSIAARILKLNSIPNITGLGTAFLGSKWVYFVASSLYKFAFKKLDTVFFQNEFDRNLFSDLSIVTMSNSYVLPGSGVDTSRFKPRLVYSKSGVFTFLLIARMIRDKGILEYIEASRILKSKGFVFEAQLLGQLNVKNKGAFTEDQILNWVKRGVVTYLGEKEDVREFISKSDCVVLPSYREGTSRTLLEAASMEKPIITTDVPGCNNIVVDGITGYLCSAGSSAALSLKMEDMMNLADSERESFGIVSRKRMIDNFSERIVIEKYLRVIENVS